MERSKWEVREKKGDYRDMERVGECGVCGGGGRYESMWIASTQASITCSTKATKAGLGIYRINHTTVSTAVLKCIIIYHFTAHTSHYVHQLTTICS